MVAPAQRVPDDTAIAPPATPAPGTTGRLAGLDGVRGLAALFVVLHHCWLLSFPGYPANTGPSWTGWLVYGHLAVVVFIVLSGFSLAVAPARAGWRVNDLGRFAHRRAWRILPAYWPALVFSLIMTWTIAPQPGEGAPTVKSVVVYGLLAQDIVGAPSPNGAFWSIAIEAQLYLIFPLMVLVLRRAGAVAMLAAVTLPVVLVAVLAPTVPLIELLMRFTPQFAALFALGIVAAGVTVHTARWRRIPLFWLAIACAVPVVVLIAGKGSVWTVQNYFWIDLAFGPSIALLLAAIASHRPRGLVRLLDIRPLWALGSFSYSLYLIHAPIVVSVYLLLVAPSVPAGVPAFLVTLAVAVPLALLVARLFAGAFELPFQRHRTWSAMRAALRAQLARRYPGARRASLRRPR